MSEPNARFRRCLDHVLRHEGGFVQHPDDPGGATNMGITLATLRDWRGADVTADDVRALTRDEAAAIYLARYWNPIRGDELPPGLDLVVFDFAVHSGVRRAAVALQRLLGVTADGVIGRKTLRAAQAADTEDAIRRLCDERLEFLRRLRTWPTFGRGWQRRVQEVREAALQMAQRGLPVTEVARTDTARGATAVAAAVTAAAAAVREVEPLITAVLPLLDRWGPTVVLVLLATLATAAVWRWRARRG